MYVAHLALDIFAITVGDLLGSAFLATRLPLLEDHVLLDTSKDFLLGAVLFFEVTSLMSDVGFI